MNLFLLRHGEAEKFDSQRHQRDADRGLTGEGQARITEEALGMKALGMTFNSILSSPYLRAQQTAQAVQKIFSTLQIDSSENLTPNATLTELIAEVQDKYDPDCNLLLVSHEPFLSDSIARLTSERVHMQAGSLCIVSLEGSQEGIRGSFREYCSPQALCQASA